MKDTKRHLCIRCGKKRIAAHMNLCECGKSHWCKEECQITDRPQIKKWNLYNNHGNSSKEDAIEDFLRESNAIEGIYDEDSLQQALYAWNYLIQEEQMTPSVILKTHKILMLHQPLSPDERGYFRKVAVSVGGNFCERWQNVPPLIQKWCINVNDMVINGQKESSLFKEKMVKDHHVNYEHIHPFVDGNGRTGRMFMNWERLKIGLPLLIIHEGDEQMDYYKWFKI